MTNLNLTKLREIAEAATPGPWKSSMVRVEPDADNALRGAGVIRDGIGSIVFMSANGPEILVSDADHIAAFDPPTVLALIDEVERLRARIEAVRAIHRVVEVEPSDTICAECSYRLPNGKYFGQIIEHPCPTMQALSGGDSNE